MSVDLVKVTYVDGSTVIGATNLNAIQDAVLELDSAKYELPEGGVPDADIASATAWNAKYDVPEGGIPSSDMTDAVVASLGLADTALQAVPNTYRTAAAQDALDAARIVRTNLLDNWCFADGGAHVINQRGSTSETSGTKYMIDRWRSGGAIEQYIGAANTNGYKITTTDSGAYVLQILDIASYDQLKGRTLTYTILYNGGLATGSGSFSTTAPTSGTSKPIDITEQIPNGNNCVVQYSVSTHRFAVCIGLTANHSLDILAVKLEIGEGQTLCHNEGTTANPVWVLNEIPIYEEQLLKCQRYFQRFRTQSLRPTYGEDFRPPMAATSPSTGTLSIGGTTYYTAYYEP